MSVLGAIRNSEMTLSRKGFATQAGSLQLTGWNPWLLLKRKQALLRLINSTPLTV